MPSNPAPERGTPPASAVPDLRRRTIDALEQVIYLNPAEPSRFSWDHDPLLHRRSEAVEALGWFAEDRAVAVLADLLQHGEQRIQPPEQGRWLRDTALLVLLRSVHLPARAVNRALTQHYSFGRHLRFWHWSEVYDDLPLLAYYHKLPVFFRAFWLWPLLLLALPALILIGEFVFRPNLGQPQSSLEMLLASPPLLLGPPLAAGVELYLVHQVIVALLAGTRGPLLRLAAPVPAWKKAWAGAGLAGLVGVLLGLSLLAFVSPNAAEQGSWESAILPAVAVVLPLLLLPMFLLAHDLEQAVRYLPPGAQPWLRRWSVILRRATDASYLLLLPIFVGVIFVWSSNTTNNLPLLGFVLYLFLVPLLVAGIFAGWARLAGPRPGSRRENRE